MLFYRRAAPAALLIASLQGCSTTSDEVASGSNDHTAGEVLIVNNSHVWAEVSAADFGKGFSNQDETPAPQNDPATVRVQQWLDRYHAIVTTMSAEKGLRLAAPKPSAALLKSGTPNAWVSTAYACPAWTLQSPSGGPAGNTYFLFEGGATTTTDMRDTCIRPQNWTDPNAFASYWNGLGMGCSLYMSGGNLTLNGGGCNAYGSQGNLTTYATSSMIAVTLEMVAWGDETRVAMTLAHELGHYYRAHSNPSIEKPLGFFYQDGPDGPMRPVPLGEASNRYQQIVEMANRVPPPLRINATTRYNKRLARVLVALKPWCPQVQADENNLKALVNGQGTPAIAAEYLAYEAPLGACVQALPLSNADVYNAFNQLLQGQRINPALTDGAATVEQGLQMISSRFDQIDADQKWLLDQVNNNGVGWYTEEQEADDLGLELATRAGFTPNEMINSRLQSSEQLEAMYKSWGYTGIEKVDMTTCKKWLGQNFMETGADGVARPVRVPLGSITDTHHEACYRLYNLWREARKHNYRVAPAPPALSPSWSTIQARATALGARPAPTAGTTTPGGGGTTTTPGGGGTTTTPPGGGTTSPEDDAGTTKTPTDPVEPDPWYVPKKKKPATEAAPDAGAAPAAAPTTVTEGGCSATGRTHGSSAFLAGIAAVLVLVRRRRSR